jgi:hypothetical protein
VIVYGSKASGSGGDIKSISEYSIFVPVRSSLQGQRGEIRDLVRIPRILEPRIGVPFPDEFVALAK